MSAYVHPSLLLPELAVRVLNRSLSNLSLLDIGGGSGTVGQHNWGLRGVSKIVVINAWEGYKREDLEFHVMHAQEALSFFGLDSFDIVQCCEVIEHMPMDDGHQLLEDMKKIARHLVVMTCPNGYTQQDPALSPQEPWSNNPYQLHVCGWTEPDFRAHGYEVEGNPELGKGCQLVPYWVRP